MINENWAKFMFSVSRMNDFEKGMFSVSSNELFSSELLPARAFMDR